MLFNSIDFAIFLPIVFLLYWFVFNKSIKVQNFFLLIVSYIFYGWWDWRFLTLIIYSSAIDYLCGLKIRKAKNSHQKKLFLTLSLFSNLGLLGVFKYYNFFIDSFSKAFSVVGYTLPDNSLNIILPVGISFYTFQTLSYTIDIYKNKLTPTKDITAFFAFVSFFPQLVAGPIERASNLLPQFERNRQFVEQDAKDGLKYILWGLFKKMVIADNCALVVNECFLNYSSNSSGNLIIGAIFFSFQIYCDFSGYSDIAVGTSRLLGFKLMRNFAYPYFSRGIPEFWRRWHISLSTWFKDYLYIPLGGGRGNNYLKARNIMIVFVVSGLWHGANWTFVFWGFLNGLYYIPMILSGKNNNFKNIDENPGISDILKILSTFSITTLTWIFFRAENINQAFIYIKNIFIFNSFQVNIEYLLVIPLIILMVSIEWVKRKQECPLVLEKVNIPFKNLIYYSLVACIIYLRPEQEISFIYFQF